MDKNKIIELIEKSEISPELKAELLALAEAENFGPETAKKIQVKLTEHAQKAIGEISDLREENATEKFNDDMDDLEKDINDFQVEANKKADEIDKKAVREELAE